MTAFCIWFYVFFCFVPCIFYRCHNLLALVLSIELAFSEDNSWLATIDCDVCACMFVCFCLFFYFSLFCLIFCVLKYHFVKIHCTHLSTIEFSFCLTNPKIELILSHLVKNFNLFGSYCNNLLLVLSIAEYLLKKFKHTCREQYSQNRRFHIFK